MPSPRNWPSGAGQTNRRQLVLLAALSLLALPASGEAGFLLSPIALPTGPLDTRLYPGLELGSHIDRAGPTLRSLYTADASRYKLGIGAFAADKLDARNLGIPGPGKAFSFGLDLVAGSGADSGRSSPAPWTDFPLTRPFEFRYEWILYRDSMGTSQLGGRLEWVWDLGAASLGLAFHNDLFGLLVRDEYRTAALEIAAGFRALGADCAASVGMRLWTGSTWGQGHLGWGESYAMTLHPPGAGYSAGILYAGFRRGMLRVELGLDSEGIRNFFQNGVHRIINDGKIPLVDRSARPYFGISLFPDGDLY
jgi:hypothetical protein